MASPEWFFSTLAQSSAAIIGFVLAFSAVLHQLERQQREKRTDTLRDELIELKDEYQYILLQAKQLFADVVSEANIIAEYDKIDKPIQSPDNPEDFLVEIVEKYNFEYPRSAVIAVYLNKLHVLLTYADADSEPSSDYLLEPEQFDQLRKTIENLIQFVGGEAFLSVELFNELNVGWGRESGHNIATDVFGMFEEDHLEQRKSAESEEKIAGQIGGWLDEKIPESEHGYSGKNIRDVMILLGQFSIDFQKVDAHRNNTLLDYEPTVSGKIIKGSAFLALTGVFTPIALLLSLPQSAQFDVITGRSVIAVEAVVLVLSAISTAYLLFIILKNLDGTWTGLHLTERLRSRVSDRKG